MIITRNNQLFKLTMVHWPLSPIELLSFSNDFHRYKLERLLNSIHNATLKDVCATPITQHEEAMQFQYRGKLIPLSIWTGGIWKSHNREYVLTPGQRKWLKENFQIEIPPATMEALKAEHIEFVRERFKLDIDNLRKQLKDILKCIK